jgi:hypothetical protein
MDEQKIANVVLVEKPSFPVLPKSLAVQLSIVYLLLLLAGVISVALFSRMKQTVDTPWALEEVASVPVLGTVPVHISERLQRQL